MNIESALKGAIRASNPEIREQSNTEHKQTSTVETEGHPVCFHALLTGK